MTDAAIMDHPTPEAAPWLGGALEAVGGAVATGVAGFLLWALKRVLGNPTAQAELNSGFVDLLSELRTELDAACVQRAELRDLLAKEKKERITERQQYRGEINQLRAIVGGLERLLRAHGIDLPPRAVTPELPTTVDATLRQDHYDEGRE